MTPKNNAEVLSGVYKSKKAMVYHMEKICVLAKLPSGANDRAVGHEWSMKESAVHAT